MNKFYNQIRRIFVLNLDNYHPAKFIFISFLFSLVVSLFDGVVDYWFFLEEESLLDALFFDVSIFEIYIRSMIVVTFTIFGALTSLFLNKINRDRELLSESELKFKTVATYLNDWIYWISKDKSFYFISPSCKSITGYSIEEFEKDKNLLNNIIYEEDKDIFVKHEQSALQGKSLKDLRFRIVTKNNEIKWIHHLCQPAYKDSVYLGHRVSNRDITRLKTAEDELTKMSKKLKDTNIVLKELVDQRTAEINTFMTQCPYPRAVYDKNGNLLSCNPSWKNELGTNPISNNIFDHSLIKNSNIEKKIKKVFQIGENFKSHPIYYEELDKLLVLDFYTISNSKYEIEKIVLSIEDITEITRGKELSEELRNRKDLIGEIFDFLDSERRHISKELHDRIGQNLMLIKMNAELITELKKYSPEKSEEIVELTLKTSNEIKEIIYSLYPEEIEKYGLVESIRNMVNRISKISTIDFSLNFSGEYLRINKRSELSIFRVVQEALNNISQHSNSKKAVIELGFTNNFIQGLITDDGMGFNTKRIKKAKYGIKFMEERIGNIGGYFELNSVIGKGTSIHFEIPLE